MGFEFLIQRLQRPQSRMWGAVVLVFCCFAGIELRAESWLLDPLWEDGMAEVCVYEGKEMRYGQLRDTRLELITVREFMDREKLVKTSPSNVKAVPVMKQNLLRNTRTGVYEYRQMSASYMHRENGDLVKVAASSQEWCGTSDAELLFREDETVFRRQNYMDDQGSSSSKVSASAQVWVEDAIILQLRSRLHSLNTGEPQLGVAQFLSNNPRWKELDVTVTSVKERRWKKKPVTEVAMKIGEVEWTFFFAKDATRKLLHLKNSRGEVLDLVAWKRFDYWNRSKPGDEKLLKQFTPSK